MAASIPSPWIVDYLISVAEEHGGNLSAIPWREKGGKAQLVKFLTFPPPGSSAPCKIWADISDKKHIIRACLTAEAVQRYMDNPLHTGKAITSHMSAFVILKRFRVSFGRVPRRDGPGMSPDSMLFLEVDEILLKGAFGEAMWDTPMDVSGDRNVKEWIGGLRQDGGAGNVLKLRKQRKDAMFAERAELAKGVRTAAPNDAPIQTTIDAMDVKVRVARRSSGRHAIAPSATPAVKPPRRVVDKEALRRASWKRFHSKVVKYFGPPDDVLDHLFTLCGESAPQTKTKPSTNNHSVAAQTPSPLRPKASSPVRRCGSSPAGTPQSSPPRSPSNWSPSVRGSPRPDDSTESSETEEDAEEELEDGSALGSDGDASHELMVQKTSSTKLGSESPVTKKPVHHHDDSSPSMSVPPPPLAQRPPRPISSSQLQAPLDPSMDVLPSSSFQPPPSSRRMLFSSKSPLYKQEPSTPAWSSAMIRRVPHPQVVSLRPDPDVSGEGRVLVVNSSQSQSQSQSQDHSQSHNDQHESGNAESQSIQQDAQSPMLQSRAEDNLSAHGGDGNGKVSVAPAESQEDSQVSAKSRQSLSYKGDSQSQEHAIGASLPGEQGPVSVPPGFDTQAGEPVTDVSTRPEDGLAEAEPEDEPQLEVEVVAPTWAAIRTEATPEDDQDSNTDEMDVDELLSDPIDKKDKKGVLPKRRSASGRKGEKDHITAAKGKGRERLESDDERTATLVNNYISQRPVVARDEPKIPVARAVSPMKPPRLFNPPAAGQSQGRLLKRRKQDVDSERTGPSLPAAADVFTSDDSFHGEPDKLPSSSAKPKQPQVVGARRASGPRKLAHDPTVWATPTFLQKPTEVRQIVMPPITVATKPPREATSAKRPIDAVASPEEQEAPTKKRKPLAVPSHSAPSSREAQPQTDRASTSSKPSKPSRKPDTTNGHPESVALRSSKASSQSSSKASRSETRTSREDQAVPLHANPPASDAKGKGKAPMRTSESGRSSGSKESGSSPGSGAARGSTQQQDAINRFVEDYKAALQPTKTPDGPPVVGWEDLMNILLETGRARREERERRSGGPSRESSRR